MKEKIIRDLEIWNTALSIDELNAEYIKQIINELELALWELILNEEI